MTSTNAYVQYDTMRYIYMRWCKPAYTTAWNWK